MPLHTQNLKAALERSDFESMAALSRHLGVSKATVGRWFKGTGEPETVKQLMELARALGTTMGHLAGQEDSARDAEELLMLRASRDADPTIRQSVIATLAASAARRPDPDKT